jgi:hypothetical protein
MRASSHLSTRSLLGALLSDPERKPLIQIAIEVCKLFLINRKIPSYYFSRYLFKKDVENILDYLPNQFLYKLKSRFNEEDLREVLENKLFFDFFYRQFNIPVPKILMYNHGKSFVVEGVHKPVNDVDTFKQLLHSAMKGGTLFVKKGYWSYGGENIHKVYPENLNQPDFLNKLFAEVIESGYLFQETIKQHPELDRLNPSCLNTLRIDTFIDTQGKINVISCYFKTNIKGHFIDNELRGGCEIPVEMETGKLKKYGHLTLKFNGIKRLTEHPITKVVFGGFQIPHFDEAKNLAIQTAQYLPNLRLIGWDVAIMESGPILVEGNGDYDIAASDLAYGGYKKNPVFQKVLQELSLSTANGVN